MDEIVRIEAEAMMSRYAKKLRSELGALVQGVYLVGSYALEDMRANSDVDFVTVVSRPLGSAERDAVLAVHDDVSDTFSRAMDGLYVVQCELRSHPSRAQALLSYSEGRLRSTVGNPLDWEILRRHGIWVYGAEPDHLQIFDAAVILPPYSQENLHKYWVPWLKRAQSARLDSMSRRALADLVMWAVLGVPRLHATIATGEILSKTGAGLYALETFDSIWFPVVRNSLAYRAQPDEQAQEVLAALSADALAFTQMVIANGQRLPVLQKEMKRNHTALEGDGA